MRLTPIVLAFVVLAGPAMATSWAQENADHRNEGRLDQPTPDGFDEARFTPLDGRVITQPTEGPAGLALAGSLAGTVAAVDATGSIAWQQDVEGEMRTAPAWNGETIVALPRGDQAFGLRADGEIAWTLPVANERDAQVVRLASPALLPSGDAILATLQGDVHRVAPDGTQRWNTSLESGGSIQATPAIDDNGDVYVAAFEPGREGEGQLVRLDGATGEQEWSISIGAQVVGAPTVHADRLLVPLRDQQVLQARSLADGALKWERGFDDRITASATIHEDLAILGDVSGTIRAIETSGGRERWAFDPLDDDPQVDPVSGAAYTVADSVAVDDEGIVWAPYWVADLSTCCPPTGSEESPLYRLDAANGEMLDRYQHRKAIHGPALHGTGVWAGTHDEGLRWFANEPSLQLHATGLDGEALVVTNTAHEGDWRIATDEEVLDEGTGRPPVTTTAPLDPGTHRITVTVDEASASTTVTVEGGAGDATDDGTDGDGEADDPSTAPDDPDGADGDEAPAEDEDTANDSGSEPQDAPLGVAVALTAVLAAVGVRARA